MRDQYDDAQVHWNRPIARNAMKQRQTSPDSEHPSGIQRSSSMKTDRAVALRVSSGALLKGASELIIEHAGK